MNKKPTPVEVLDLIIEDSFTKLNDRPGMIDHAYNRVVQEWVGALTEQEKAELDLMRLIAEAEVPWRTAQITVLTSLIEHSVIARWAKDTIQGWDAASISGKTSKLFIALDKLGILEKGRDIFMGKGKPLDKGPNIRDIEDPAAFEVEFRELIIKAVLEDIHKRETEQKP